MTNHSWNISFNFIELNLYLRVILFARALFYLYAYDGRPVGKLVTVWAIRMAITFSVQNLYQMQCLCSNKQAISNTTPCLVSSTDGPRPYPAYRLLIHTVMKP
jgi:hypothetical protein